MILPLKCLQVIETIVWITKFSILIELTEKMTNTLFPPLVTVEAAVMLQWCPNKMWFVSTSVKGF